MQLTIKQIETKIEEIHAAMDGLKIDEDKYLKLLYKTRMEQHTGDLKILVESLLLQVEKLDEDNGAILEEHLKGITLVARSIQSGLELFCYGEEQDENEEESSEEEVNEEGENPTV